MTTTTHTPGPWKVGAVDANDDHTKPVSVFEAACDESPHKLRVADVYAWGCVKERDATAKLIAAAPALLEACELAQDALMAALPHADRIRDILLPALREVQAAIKSATA